MTSTMPPGSDESRITSRARQQQTLKPSDFAVYGSHFERLTATIPTDCMFDDAMRPEFWAYVAPSLQRDKLRNVGDRTGSVIELRRQDNAFYAELYVRKVLQTGLEVVCIGPSIDSKTGKACPLDLVTGLPWGEPTQKSEVPPLVFAETRVNQAPQLARKAVEPDPKEQDGKKYRMVWNAKHRGFDIVQSSDGTRVADAASCPTKKDAMAWISNIGGIAE